MSWVRIRWGLAILLAIPVIFFPIVVIRIFGAISSIPVSLGERINIEGTARKFVTWAVDLEIAHEFRDDLLYLLEEHVYRLDEESDKLDSWFAVKYPARASEHVCIRAVTTGDRDIDFHTKENLALEKA